MKASKIILALFIAHFFLFVPRTIFCQTETLDIVQYTPPKGWTKTPKEGAVVYSDTNKTTNAFCLLTIYSSTSSVGTPQQDFVNEWNNLVVKPFKAQANPKTETQTNPDGWQATAGAAEIGISGVKSYAILTVFSGFGKTTSVLAILNDQSYVTQLDAFTQSIKLDKTKTATNTNPGVQNNNSTSTTNSNSASPGKFGHLIYKPMEGWKQKNYSNAASFIPNDLSPEHSFEVRIMESKAFSGSMQQALAESWNDALQQLQATKFYDGDPYKIETEKTSYKGWEYIRGWGVFRPNGNQNDRYDMRLFVVKLNNRIERIAVIGLLNISHGDFSPWANPAYEHAIEEFFYTIKFDDWKEPDFKSPSSQSERIAGLYEGLKLGGGILNAAYTLFFPNGQVFSGPKFPLYGFYGLNTWVEAELRTKYWGTYTLQNGKGIIKMGYGNIPIKVLGNDLIVTTQNTDHKYERVPSIDGAVFNGTYAFQGDWGGKPPSVTFTTDGKFIDNGALDILHHQTTDPFNITKEPGSGTYLVKDYTLVFNYSDGRKVQLVFMGEGYDRKNLSPATLTLSFNNDTLIKK